LFYDRPKKKPRRPKARPPVYEEAPVKKRFFLTPGARKREEERLERLRLEEERKKRRFSLLRFLFETPRKRPEENEEEVYTSDESEEDYAHAPKKRKKHLLVKAILCLLAFTALFAYLLYLLPVGLFSIGRTNDDSSGRALPSGCTHVLLIGVDKDTHGTSRSDTMLIASVSKKSVHLTSLMRDTGVVIPGKSGTHRLNAAYAYGGAELLLKTVNQNFGMDISRYILADYESFPKLIDLLGGVNLSISEAEMHEINGNVQEILWRKVVSGEISYEKGLALYQRETLSSFGESTHLSGTQALGYARIRSLDSDYGRTNRQRKLLTQAVSSLKSHIYNPVSLAGIGVNALSMIETNMNALEIASLGLKACASSGISQTRLPVNGTFTDNGGMFFNVDFEKNREAFLSFVYGSK